MDIKTRIENEIKGFFEEYQKNLDVDIKLWGEPIVGYADVQGEYIRNLRKNVHPEHQMPEEVLEDAKCVLVYYVPFTEEVVSGNDVEGLSTPLWAMTYEYANAMFGACNEHLIEVLKDEGYKAAIAPESLLFYREELKSHWSQRHFAYAAGLGTFGMNNMMLTEKGCSGRVTTLVTNLDVECGKPLEEEVCLYKRDGSCGICMDKCPDGALKPEGFDRKKCHEQCHRNAIEHTQFGSSYETAPGEECAKGSEVCGKCLTGLPCSFRRP